MPVPRRMWHSPGTGDSRAGTVVSMSPAGRGTSEWRWDIKGTSTSPRFMTPGGHGAIRTGDIWVGTKPPFPTGAEMPAPGWMWHCLGLSGSDGTPRGQRWDTKGTFVSSGYCSTRPGGAIKMGDVGVGTGNFQILWVPPRQVQGGRGRGGWRTSGWAWHTQGDSHVPWVPQRRAWGEHGTARRQGTPTWGQSMRGHPAGCMPALTPLRCVPQPGSRT